MKITINGNPVVFDAQISYSIINSLFSREISSSLQYSIPDDIQGINRRALGYINRADLEDNKTRELPQVIEHGMLYLSGTVVAKYQGAAFACYFKSNSDFWSLIQDKLLSELPFDIVDLTGLTTAQFQALVNDYNRTDVERNFAFPTILNKKIFDSFPVKFNYLGAINVFTNNIIVVASQPVIPFLYLRYIFRTIFERNGISIRENAFDEYPELARLILANNYIINEYEIDRTVLQTKNGFIQKVTSGKDPVVTTSYNHGLSQYQYVMVENLHAEISLATTNNKIFQAEIIDSKNFKLIGADTSDQEEYDNFFIAADSIEKIPAEEKLRLRFDDHPIAQEILDLINEYCYLRSNDWEGAVRVDFENAVYVDINMVGHNINWNITFFTSSTLLQVNRLDPPPAVLKYLPINLINHFRKIDPRNHVPEIKVNDFIEQCFNYTGILSFVNDASKTVDLVHIRDIILSKEYIDISQYAGPVEDIENPDISGYLLQMQADASDEYYKAKLPVSSLDDKYTRKDPVATVEDLPLIGSETNDIRKVTTENSWYVFSKSFLNAVNNWKFLTYDHLDLADGEQEYKHVTNFSTLLPEIFSERTYASMSVIGECNTFLDVVNKINPRILTYHGVLDRGFNNLPYASMDVTDENGDAIPGATLKHRWEGAGGLYETFWKEYIYWRLNIYKECQCLIQWPEHLILDFNQKLKYRIRGVDYFVKKIPVVLSHDRKIYSSKTELVRV